VITGTETPQLNLLTILDLFRITVSPFNRNIRVRVGVDHDVERAIAVQHWQERDGCGDLSEDGLDFFLDL
jgi:hypothetical protein